MNIPAILSHLIEAQNDFNAIAYANCFNKEALVFDEGENHHGREAIKAWIEAANLKYKTQLKALSFLETDHESVLTAEVSGTFEGSPIVLNYHVTFQNELIENLKISI